MEAIKVLFLEEGDVLKRLQIEEALLRAGDDNWCVIGSGTSLGVVMGISGRQEVLLDGDLVKENNVPVIKRFSGGGTVVVDENTIFVSFIFNKRVMVPEVVNPKSVVKWFESFYEPVFSGKGFSECGNDYVFGDRKFGGNAQYITRDRFVHHTSFLWDYDEDNMKMLKIPARAPAYRCARGHRDFLCRMKDSFASKEEFFTALMERLEQRFIVEEGDMTMMEAVLACEHRRATCLVREGLRPLELSHQRN